MHRDAVFSVELKEYVASVFRGLEKIEIFSFT